ncbi:DUF502 domain-containing protein [Thermopirellula anaerolimosa]
MRTILRWLWQRGVIGNFLSGLVVILPLLITILAINWVASFLLRLLAADAPLGKTLRAIGLNFVTHEASAVAAGLIVVAVGIWAIGLFSRSRAQMAAARWVEAMTSRIPLVGSVYSTAAQMVKMLQPDQKAEMSAMSVVFCTFGETQSCGLLALLASPDRLRIGDREYCVVYIPTSPVPMSGGVLLVPAEQVQQVPMSVERLMQIYLSMGVMTSSAVPPELVVQSPSPGDTLKKPSA